MIKKSFLLGAVFFALITTFTAHADTKIAVLDMASVIKQLPQQEEIKKKLEKEFGKKAEMLRKQDEELRKKVENFARDRSVMKAADITKTEKEVETKSISLISEMKALDLDIARRQTEENAKVRDFVWKIVQKVAEKTGYQMVIEANTIFYLANEKDDITAEVIKQVKQAK